MSEEANLILGGLSNEPTYAEIQRVGNKLLKLPIPENVPNQARIILASSFSIDPIAPALAIECHKIGLWPTIQVDGFDQYRSHILKSTSPLYEFSPDIVFLAAELGSIIPLSDDDIDYEAVATDACVFIKGMVKTFKRHSSVLLVMHNFASSPSFPFTLTKNEYQAKLIQLINTKLVNIYSLDSQVCILDFEALCAYHGKSRITNPKLHYLGAIEISESFLPVITKQYIAYIKALKGLTRKCLVLDLDGTLWGGILGEEGIDGISLSSHGVGCEYYDFQKAILALYQRGVILAVNSKNNAPDAFEVLREHPAMVLREEHFASLQINWNDKASNLRAIAKELNIGLDSLVFMDDSPVERAWIRQALPEVLVVDLPVDPTLYVQTLESLTDFEVISLTDEDTRRGALYVSERNRREFSEESGNFEAFLSGLNMILTVGIAQSKDIPRVAQLTRKTNQFNMTTRRYTDAEIEGMLSQPDTFVYTLRVRDIFGDSGLVGLVILKEDTSHWKIDTFLISCRILGRTIEQAFLSEVLRDGKKGILNIEGEFIPTSKNVLASDFYKDFGFARVSAKEGHTFWQLDVSNWAPRHLEWFTIESK